MSVLWRGKLLAWTYWGQKNSLSACWGPEPLRMPRSIFVAAMRAACLDEDGAKELYVIFPAFSVLVLNAGFAPGCINASIAGESK